MDQIETTLADHLGLDPEAIRTCLRWARARVPYQDAEDVLQDVTLELLRARPASGAIAFGVTRHVIADWYRSRREAESLDELAEVGFEPVAEEPEATAALEAREELAQLPAWVVVAGQRAIEGTLRGQDAVRLHAWARLQASRS